MRWETTQLISLHKPEVSMLTKTDQQLAMNLSYLLPEDSSLLNDIILEYVEMVSNTNRSHDLLEFTNNEMRSIV